MLETLERVYDVADKEYQHQGQFEALSQASSGFSLFGGWVLPPIRSPPSGWGIVAGFIVADDATPHHRSPERVPQQPYQILLAGRWGLKAQQRAREGTATRINHTGVSLDWESLCPTRRRRLGEC